MRKAGIVRVTELIIGLINLIDGFVLVAINSKKRGKELQLFDTPDQDILA